MISMLSSHTFFRKMKILCAFINKNNAALKRHAFSSRKLKRLTFPSKERKENSHIY